MEEKDFLIKKNKLLSKINENNIIIFNEINRFWLTNFTSSFGVLFLTKTKNYYFLDSRYYNEFKNKVKNWSNIEVILFKNFEQVFLLIKNINNKKNIYFEKDYISYKLYILISSTLKNFKLIPFKIQDIRVEKNEKEIKIIQKLTKKTENIFTELIKYLKLLNETITEKDIEKKLFELIYKNGYSHSFFPIVVSGKNTSFPHGKAKNKKILKNDLITIDFGIKYKGYCSDITRTFSLGKVSKKIEKHFKIIKNSLKIAENSLEENLNFFKADLEVRKYLKNFKLDGLFCHALGHGVGLEVHEKPIISSLKKNNLNYFKNNIIFTLEPGIYFKNKFGIRLENMYLYKNKKLINLTKKNIKLYL